MLRENGVVLQSEMCYRRVVSQSVLPGQGKIAQR